MSSVMVMAKPHPIPINLYSAVYSVKCNGVSQSFEQNGNTDQQLDINRDATVAYLNRDL